MHDDKTVQRFVELRSQGWTFARIATELKVSKPTLINWSRKHQFQIQNLRAVELEALADQWLSSVSDRLNSLGEHLHKIEAELATRDVKDLSTTQLYSVARNLRRQIQQTAGPVQFTSPVGEIPGEEYHDQVEDWKG
jgi:transcriptional regulator with XRE-family HTH domain